MAMKKPKKMPPSKVVDEAKGAKMKGGKKKMPFGKKAKKPK